MEFSRETIEGKIEERIEKYRALIVIYLKRKREGEEVKDEDLYYYLDKIEECEKGKKFLEGVFADIVEDGECPF